jgi:hypothetical protein
MHSFLHWGEQLNWIPVAFLGIASVTLFMVRLLTVWCVTQIYSRELLSKMRQENESFSDAENGELLAKLTSIIFTRISDGKTMFPAFVSKLYKLAAAAFVVAAIWGLLSTAWWIFLLALLTWYFVHLPFRDTSLSMRDISQIWLSILTVASTSADVESIKKGGLTFEQEKEMKNRLGI